MLRKARPPSGPCTCGVLITNGSYPMLCVFIPTMRQVERQRAPQMEYIVVKQGPVKVSVIIGEKQKTLLPQSQLISHCRNTFCKTETLRDHSLNTIGGGGPLIFGLILV